MTAQPTGSTTTPHDASTRAQPSDMADTALAMVLLWAIPAIAFLLTLTRL